MIRMILNNTEMNIHTAYTYHNYAIINTILLYSNFLLAYYSYLHIKQWIIKLHKTCITEYFSLPYDFTSWHENRLKRLWEPLSGIYCFSSCPAIIYYINKNIHSVNLHKISRAFLCNILYWLFRLYAYNKSIQSEAQTNKNIF